MEKVIGSDVEISKQLERALVDLKHDNLVGYRALMGFVQVSVEKISTKGLTRTSR